MHPPGPIGSDTAAGEGRRVLTGWRRSGKGGGRKTADRKPRKNQELWGRLDAIASRHEIEWHWVKGHSGVPGNERVDRLANAAIDALLG